MDTPRSFPFLVYYFDGYRTLVDTLGELALLPPGYSLSREGPFPEDGQGWPWRPERGPFSHASAWSTFAFDPSRDPSVYALRELIVDGIARLRGEVFRAGTLEIEELLRRGDLRRSDPSLQFGRHRPTDRFFTDFYTWEAACIRYEARDLTGFEPRVPLAQEAASTPAPEDALPLESPERLPTDAQLLRGLKRAARVVRQATRPLTQANLGYYHVPRRGRNWVRKALKHLQKKLTDL